VQRIIILDHAHSPLMRRHSIAALRPFRHRLDPASACQHRALKGPLSSRRRHSAWQRPLGQSALCPP
jgi:hypothetical protein